MTVERETVFTIERPERIKGLIEADGIEDYRSAGSSSRRSASVLRRGPGQMPVR